MTRAGEMKKRLSLGARVAIDQYRLLAAFARLAAINAALAAGTKARVIGPWPIDLRRLAVVLFEARAHFALELFLQAKRWRQHRVGVGVLGLHRRRMSAGSRLDRATPRANCRPASRNSRPPTKDRGRRALRAAPRLGVALGSRLARPLRAPIACWSWRSPPRGTWKHAKSYRNVRRRFA